MCHNIRFQLYEGTMVSIIREPSSSSRLSLIGLSFVSLSFPTLKRPPSSSTPMMKLGWMYRSLQNTVNLGEIMYISLVVNPMSPTAKCLTAVGNI